MKELNVDHRDDGVTTITINRPERRNALDDSLLLEVLPDTFATIAKDQSIKVVVLTGAGGAFCAGADLECSGLDQPSPLASHEFMRKSHRTVQEIRKAPQTVIAAIDGAAVGAGLGLAAACDLRISTPESVFVAPFLRMGLPPDYGSSYFLPRVIGPELALDMFLTCRQVKGDEALGMRLVSRLSSTPLEDALELAKVIAQNPRHALGQTKLNVYEGLEQEMAPAVENEIRSVAIALHSNEFDELFTEWRKKIRG